MSIQIYLLPAEYGDCIFLSAEGFNILIDGGTSKTYQDGRDRRCPDKALKILIEELQAKGEHIDLLIITHVDDDHIGGIIEWFGNNYPVDGFICEIWMNDNIILPDMSSLQNSPKSARSLIEIWKENGQCYDNNIILGVEKDRGPFHIRVLAPLPKYRNKVAQKMDINLQNSGEDMSTYKTALKKLVEEPWVCNRITVENRASIALEISLSEDEKILMTGDAHIEDIMDGLDYFYPEKERQLFYSVVKLSHHGSKNNFVPQFLERIKAKVFLVSTNGECHNHPDKEVIAQIICKTDANVGFNYKQRSDKLFTDQDFQDFPDLQSRIFETPRCLTKMS